MRKITAGLFIALDGIVEAPDQWPFPRSVSWPAKSTPASG